MDERPAGPGFFLPYRHADHVRDPGNPAFGRLLASHAGWIESWLEQAARELPALQARLGDPPAPRFTQDWFPRLDGLMAFTVVRTLRPRRILEIGSGHSTRFMAAALQDGDAGCRLTCIDPEPRADIARLPVEHLPHLFDRQAARHVEALGRGDLLFVDSSHLAVPGTDVDLLFGELIPGLPDGVILHVHDVFLPDPYPAAWAWRGYNEHALVAALHLAGALTPFFSSHWAATRMTDVLARLGLDSLPLLPGALEGSLWSVRGPAAAEKLQAQSLSNQNVSG